MVRSLKLMASPRRARDAATERMPTSSIRSSPDQHPLAQLQVQRERASSSSSTWWFVDQRAGDGDAALASARRSRDRRRGHREPDEGASCPPPRGSARGQPAICGPNAMFCATVRCGKRALLEDGVDLALVRRELRDVPPVQQDAPAVRALDVRYPAAWSGAAARAEQGKNPSR